MIVVFSCRGECCRHTYTAPTTEPGDLQSSEVLFLFSSFFPLWVVGSWGFGCIFFFVVVVIFVLGCLLG